MSKKANPTAIGAFVIGAVALIVLALALLGGGKLFSTTETYVLFFDRSLKGLRVGANVTFRGIRIGQVRDVYVEIDEEKLDFEIPVIIEIESNSFRSVEGKDVKMSDDEKRYKSDQEEIKELDWREEIRERELDWREELDRRSVMQILIGRGLRAILELESIVTGQLLIDLDFYPDTEVILRSATKKYIEIPTIPSEIQRVMAGVRTFASKLEHLDIEDLVNDLKTTIEGIEDIVNSPEVTNIIKGIDQLVNSDDTQEIAASIQTSLKNLDATMEDIQRLAVSVDQQVDPMASEFLKTLQNTRSAIDDIQGTFTDIRSKVNDETIRYELSTAINELSNAARSFRIFVDFLERHPESFLSGKPNTQ